MAVVLVFKEDVVGVISRCSTQGGRSSGERYAYDDLKGEYDMHGVDGSVMCLDGINVYVGRHIDGVHGVCGVGQRNLEGGLLL